MAESSCSFVCIIVVLHFGAESVPKVGKKFGVAEFWINFDLIIANFFKPDIL